MCKVSLEVEMTQVEIRNVCRIYGIKPEELCVNIRTSKKGLAKCKFIIHLRDILRMKYKDIAGICGYHDRSGARQAYEYGRKLINKSKDGNDTN